SCLCTSCFTATARTDIYTPSLHDALPIFEGLNFYPGYNVFVTLPLSTFFERPHAKRAAVERYEASQDRVNQLKLSLRAEVLKLRSEEHTSELQSRENLVCRLLLEKKNKES